MPPEKVEVPVPPTSIVEEAWNRPLTFKVLEMVEEAREISPAPAVKRSPTKKVEPTDEEAKDWKPPVRLAKPKILVAPVIKAVEEAWRAPPMFRAAAAVDEAEVIKPPLESI